MGEDAAVGLHPALSGGVRAHAGEALVPGLVRRGPRQRPQRHRVDHDVLAVGGEAAQTRCPTTRARSPVPSTRHREAGELVGLAQRTVPPERSITISTACDATRGPTSHDGPRGR